MYFSRIKIRAKILMGVFSPTDLYSFHDEKREVKVSIESKE